MRHVTLEGVVLLVNRSDVNKRSDLFKTKSALVFRTHLEANLPNVCDFAVLGNLKVDFSSLLRSTERMLQLL